MCLHMHTCVFSRQTLLLPKSFLHLGFCKSHIPFMLVGFLGGSGVKNPHAVQEMWVQSLSWKDPLEEERSSHSNILVGKSHGQRRLSGYSP